MPLRSLHRLKAEAGAVATEQDRWSEKDGEPTHTFAAWTPPDE